MQIPTENHPIQALNQIINLNSHTHNRITTSQLFNLISISGLPVTHAYINQFLLFIRFKIRVSQLILQFELIQYLTCLTIALSI
ncbi:unnamed protein product [Paramecium octaurelia]|uniref:Uncharacterized protein n=1 Tax=Paramecium octaurelia TaxID=43137 RepID=A0A8S1UQC7_PAROT|nr:unnamed protein product [Paramecium octaurelia]